MASDATPEGGHDAPTFDPILHETDQGYACLVDGKVELCYRNCLFKLAFKDFRALVLWLVEFFEEQDKDPMEQLREDESVLDLIELTGDELDEDCEVEVDYWAVDTGIENVHWIIWRDDKQELLDLMQMADWRLRAHQLLPVDAN